MVIAHELHCLASFSVSKIEVEGDLEASSSSPVKLREESAELSAGGDDLVLVYIFDLPL